MANAKFIEAWCKKKVKDLEKLIVYDLANQVAKDTQRNFKMARDEVPAMDWYVDVWTSQLGNNAVEVVCGGTQVLFIEFGAGNKHKQETSTYIKVGNVEYASRPNGIVPIGGYGKGRGKDDSWIFKDYNLIPDTESESSKKHTHLLRGSSDGGFIYRTGGIRPVRALYRGIASGVKKITTKRIRRLR